jgi:hypothetical protein
VPLAASTANVWLPAASVLKVAGLVQLVKGALSRLHSNVTPEELSLKEKLALVSVVVAGGCESIVGVGGTTIDHDADAGALVPPVSTPTTLKVWEPSARPL